MGIVNDAKKLCASDKRSLMHLLTAPMTTEESSVAKLLKNARLYKLRTSRRFTEADGLGEWATKIVRDQNITLDVSMLDESKWLLSEFHQTCKNVASGVTSWKNKKLSVLVVTNLERMHINCKMVEEFAKQRKQAVYKWRRVCAWGENVTQLENERRSIVLAAAYRDRPELTDVFVQGMEMALCQHVLIHSLGIPTHTPCYLFSMTGATKEITQAYNELAGAHGATELLYEVRAPQKISVIMFLPLVGDAARLLRKHDNKLIEIDGYLIRNATTEEVNAVTEWGGVGGTSQVCVVLTIPAYTHKFLWNYEQKAQACTEPDRKRQAQTVLEFQGMSLQPTFAKTVHAAEGATLEAVLADLRRRSSTKLGRCDFNHTYVTLTRARSVSTCAVLLDDNRELPKLRVPIATWDHD